MRTGGSFYYIMEVNRATVIFTHLFSQAAEERRKQKESLQMASLAEKQKKAEEVRAKKATIVETSENSCDN